MTAKEFIENHKNLAISNIQEWDGEDAWFLNDKEVYKIMIEFAQYHVKEALKSADEKSQVICGEDIIKDAYGELFWVDSESILNAYQLTNIK